MSESSASPTTCPQCGAALPSTATDGLCPRCLMAEAMVATQTEAGLAEAPKILPPGELAPHFPHLEILECLGRGGMGVVYKARQKTLNRFVALKLLAPERVPDAKFTERFTREAQALAALNHPNIVTIHDFGQAGGFYFLLMEFVDGLNLRQLLRTRKLTPEEALAIVPPLCDALQFAHDRGIVHRDIKPENLLLDKQGRIKVADFGIAKILGSATGADTGTVAPGTATQTTSGTPGYSAPEQQSHPERADSRADIYSLGVVFYEMLTGELPGQRIEPPSKKVHIDVRLDEIVLRALEAKPELRYQQASTLKTQVETITGSLAPVSPAASGKTPNPVHAGEKIARRSYTLIFLSLCLILLGALSIWDMAWHARFGVSKLDLTLIGLPVGVGLLRLRSFWRRGFVNGVWLGYASLLFLLAMLLARATGQKPFLTPSGILGWQPEAVSMTWLAITCLLVQVVLLGCLHRELLQPAIKNHFEPSRGRGPGWLEMLVVVALLVFAAGWIPLQVRSTHRLTGVAAEMWSPPPGEIPNPAKIRDEIKAATDQTHYEEALQRQIWYFNHALEYDPSLSGVRLSFTLSDWAELGRSYPKAQVALIEIRDHDLHLFDEGMRYPHGFSEIFKALPGFARPEKPSRFDLFQEIFSLNNYLGDNAANEVLRKNLVAKDPQLAQHMGYRVSDDAFDMLVKKSTAGASPGDIGDGQAAFSAICQQWIYLKKNDVRMEKMNAQIHSNMDAYWTQSGHQPPVSPLPRLPITPPKVGDDIFVNKTRQLIEILVASGHQSDAENIRDQALALHDDPWLKVSVSDALAKIHSSTTATPASPAP